MVRLLADIVSRDPLPGQGIHVNKSRLSHQYIFARLSGRAIQALVSADGVGGRTEVKDVQAQATAGNAVYRIWPDFPIARLTTKSISTVKADAAHNAFARTRSGHRLGRDGLWYRRHPPALREAQEPRGWRRRCGTTTSRSRSATATPLVDVLRHGTHVAAIIAGRGDAERDGPIEAQTRFS